MTGTGVPFWNVSFSGKSWTALLNGTGCPSPAAKYTELVTGNVPSIAVLNGGQSDILSDAPNENQTGAQAFADLLTYIAAIRALGVDKVIVTTMTPMGWGTADPARVAEYNNLVRAGHASIDAIVDLAAVPALMNSADTTYYSDTVHYTAAGATVAADAVRPVVMAMVRTVAPQTL